MKMSVDLVSRTPMATSTSRLLSSCCASPCRSPRLGHCVRRLRRLWLVGNADSTTPPAVPAPAVDCSTVVLSMEDCLTYVTGGAEVKKPEGNCCLGLKTVLKSASVCLCETFRNRAQFGITLNVSPRSLPRICTFR